MQLLLDIEENKADFVLELINNFKFVKAQLISKEKYDHLDDLISAAKEVNGIKSGQIEASNAREFLDEL